MLRTGYYVKQMKSIRFFNPSSVLYMRAQVNSSNIANICWLIHTFKYQFCGFGFQVHFESNMVYNLKTKSDFFIKISTLYNGLHNKFGLFVFPSFIGLEFGIYRLITVPNLKCIHAVFAMLWPLQKMLVPRCSTASSVAKRFCCVYIRQYWIEFFSATDNFTLLASLQIIHRIYIRFASHVNIFHNTPVLRTLLSTKIS